MESHWSEMHRTQVLQIYIYIYIYIVYKIGFSFTIVFTYFLIIFVLFQFQVHMHCFWSRQSYFQCQFTLFHVILYEIISYYIQTVFLLVCDVPEYFLWSAYCASSLRRIQFLLIVTNKKHAKNIEVYNNDT